MELMAIPLILPILAGLVLVGLGHDVTDPAFGEALENERRLNNDN
jgi:hypothetical protein